MSSCLIQKLWQQMVTKSVGLHEYRDFDHFREDVEQVLQFRYEYYDSTPLDPNTVQIMYVDKRGWVPGNVQVYATRAELDAKYENDNDTIDAARLTSNLRDYGVGDLPPEVRAKVLTNLLINENYRDPELPQLEDVIDLAGVRAGSINQEQGYE